MFTVLLAGALLGAPVPKAIHKFPPDPERMLGEWEIIVNEANGQPRAETQPTIWTFTDGNMNSSSGNTNWKIKLDPTQTPKHIDIGSYLGVYDFDGEKLTVVYSLDGQRPVEVKSGPINYMSVLVKTKK